MRVSQTVSTVRKSHASIVAACWRRNCRQLALPSFRCRRQPAADQDRANRTRGERDAESAKLTNDPPVTPGWVLARKPKHESSCRSTKISNSFDPATDKGAL